jgi:hypothetical protein
MCLAVAPIEVVGEVVVGCGLATVRVVVPRGGLGKDHA